MPNLRPSPRAAAVFAAVLAPALLLAVPALLSAWGEVGHRITGEAAALRLPADMPAFVQRHGMPGFAPTQGHIPSGVPFMAHARRAMLAGEMRRAMVVSKGSLFLGKMTQLSDGMSFMLDAPQ